MADNPTVSIIIPLFNKELSIRRAIASALNQTYCDFEIVVVDDGSTDGSVAILKAIRDPRIITVSQKNTGPGAARNRGAEVARGKYIAFLDADDEWRTGYLETAIEALESHAACAAFACGYDSGNFRDQRPNKLEVLGKFKGPLPPPWETQGRDMKLHVDALHSSAVVVRGDIFHTLGGFYTENGCRYGEDSWLYARLLFSQPIFWDPAEHVRFHVEDSDLGFAVRKRAIARPISLHPDRLGADLNAQARVALRRLSAVYAISDYNLLTASGAWPAARALRRHYKIGGRLGAVKELARRLKYFAKKLCGNI